jgi:uncharacterized Tic20 family protein
MDSNQEPVNPTPPPVPETPVSAAEAVPPDLAVPPPVPAKSAFGDNMDINQWGMFLHLSQLLGLVVPVLGFAAPLVIWLTQKTPFPALDTHGKMVANWMISLLIYSIVATVIGLATCGFGFVLFVPLGIVSIVFPIIGGVKAKDGELWKYPVTIPFIK